MRIERHFAAAHTRRSPAQVIERPSAFTSPVNREKIGCKRLQMAHSELDELREENYVLGLQVAKLRVSVCS